jgi:hypothetical protein
VTGRSEEPGTGTTIREIWGCVRRDRFANSRRGSGGHRRPVRRTLLASIAGTVLLSTVGALVLSTAAGAHEIGPLAGQDRDDGIGIQAFWFLRPDDRVAFKDIGGQCDRAKVYPDTTVRDLTPKSHLGFYLYTAYSGGSCLFKESNAQYRVDITEPSGRTLWTNINVTENGYGSRSYRVDCYGDRATLPCHPDSRFLYHSVSQMGPLVWFGAPSGPSGYTWCSPEGYSCSNLPRRTTSVAYGADGRFVYRSEDVSRYGIYPCSTGQFFGQDPAPGWYKSCYYKP